MKHKLLSHISFLKKVKRPKRLHDPQLMHPEREWSIGLLVAVMLFIGAASISAYTYFSNQAIDMEAVEDTTKDTVYRESLVKEVLNTINERENRLELLNRKQSQTTESAPVSVEAAPVVDEEIEAVTTRPISE